MESQALHTPARQWMSSASLGGPALDNLYAINRLYLGFLTGTPSAAAPFSPRPLPGPLAHGIVRLDEERRSDLARCPFSLFDARFTDGAFWNGLSTMVREPSVFADKAPAPVMNFTALALFYAWHLTRTDPLASRILLGMSDRTRARFLELPLPHIQQLATELPDLILPRWPDREVVWQILIGAAYRGPEHMKTARLFGIQLIAGDLVLAESSVQSR